VALKLVMDYKGLSAEYWKILKSDTNFLSGETVVRLGLYKDKATRDANIADYLLMEAMRFNISDKPLNDLYIEVKKPIYETVVDPATGDSEEVQVNKFVDAVDVLEVGEIKP